MVKKIVLMLSVVLCGLGIFLILNSGGKQESEQSNNPNAETVSESAETKSTALKQFTGEEFRDLFDNLSLPNTTPIVEAPAITGDTRADKHIQALAEARGYKLRLVAAGQLSDYKGQELQVLLLEDWKDLKKAARDSGIDLSINSGYRSVSEQKKLFISELAKLGLSNSQIISGAGDTQINVLLQTVSPPGYSRHHSGYTIDLADASASVFAYSKGYQWISANNFENAKKYGFIPSYPEDVEKQGPNPEPWEYVWANRDFVVE